MDLMQHRIGLIGGKAESGARLPDEYQEVEYIEGTGTQYVDTGLRTTGDIYGFFVDAQFTGELGETTEIRYICGSRTSYTTDRITVQVQGNKDDNNMQFETNKAIKMPDVSPFERHTYKLSPLGAYVDGVSKDSDVSITRSGYNFYIFNITNGSNAPVWGRFWKGRIYGLDLVGIDGKPVYRFIPCYRKSDGEIGMYELKTKMFATNAGTGTFLKGADV